MSTRCATRIQRIEQLTGRDMSAMRDRVDLYLALTCLDVADPAPAVTSETA